MVQGASNQRLFPGHQTHRGPVAEEILPEGSLVKEQNEIHREWAQMVEDESRNLTAWEEGFVASVIERLDAGYHLTETQAETLERIYAEKTP